MSCSVSSAREAARVGCLVSLIRWLLGLVVGLLVAILGLLGGILRLLQRRSKQLTRSTVSAVLKEAPCVSGSDCIERLSHILHQRFPAPSLRLTEKTFDLRE